VGREVELKLTVPPSEIDEIVRLPWLREISKGAPKCEKLVTVYFDTPKFRLREHGLASDTSGKVARRLLSLIKKVRAASLAVTNGKKKSKMIRPI
jgi:hypothetical protein